jgi:XTP/dITP diphosphohydrolase
MQELIFVTNNKHKLSEIRAILDKNFKILSLSDIGFSGEIAETSATIAGNSMQKTKFIFDKFGKDCFGDDTGLLIDALNGEPGVYSARYAGEDATYNDNMQKVLRENARKNKSLCTFYYSYYIVFQWECISI